jgi:hypothetical protein
MILRKTEQTFWVKPFEQRFHQMLSKPTEQLAESLLERKNSRSAAT